MARILIVDDDRAICTVLERFFQKHGHDVALAEDGRAALRSVQASPPDVVLTDINMPHADGIEVINALRDADIDVPVVAMSGGGRIDKTLLLDSAGALGAVATVEKPFDLEDLLRVVEELL